MDEVLHYMNRLNADLIEQFRGNPKISVFMAAYARQLQEVYMFLSSIRLLLDIDQCSGVQLDGIGDIVVLSRGEARKLMASKYQGEVLDDTVYRKLLKYKILLNTNTGTYGDVVKGFRTFWDKTPIYYSEEPEFPATMIFRTPTLTPEINGDELLEMPVIKPAGVALRMFVTTQTDLPYKELYIGGGFQGSVNETDLPELDFERGFDERVAAAGTEGGSFHVTQIPELESSFEFNAKVPINSHTGSIAQSTIPRTDEKEV